LACKAAYRQFNDEFGDRLISSVTKSDIRNFQLKLLKAGKAPATVDHIIGKTKTMLNAGVEDGRVGPDALKAFKVKNTLIKGSDVRTRILSQDEFKKLLEHAPEHIKPIIACGYYTGMRRGEILTLTWDNINLKKRHIEIDAKKTKDNEKRVVPISNELFQILVSLPTRIQKSGRDNHVFQYAKKPIKSIAKALKNACEKAGIIYGRFKKDGFVFHDLRHTFNTNMRKDGVQESVIMEITGHSTREMFDRYNTIDEEDTRNAVKTLEDYFANVDLHVDLNEKEATVETVTS
jgi:integrase